jgi:hypothetical protein
MIRHGQSALDNCFASGVRVSKWVGLVAILLSFLFVLAGCGSDSGSPQTGAKNNLADKKDKKVEVKQGLGQPKESPKKMQPVYGVVLDGMTEEELKLKKEQGMRLLQDSNEVFPGVTREAMRAKEAAAAKQLQNPDLQVFPGVKKKDLNARQAAADEQLKLQGSKLQAIPGVTQEVIEAKRAEAAKQLKNPDLMVLPGLTAGELRAKQAEAAKMNMVPPPPPVPNKKP